MFVENHIDDAQSRVISEQRALDRKQEAYQKFIHDINSIEPNRRPSSTTSSTTTGGTVHYSSDTSSVDRCRLVRKIFTETIRPHSIADIEESEPLLETISEEFTDEIAIALAPTTGTLFTPELKQLILTESKAQKLEIEVFQRTLDKEKSRLSNINNTLECIANWIIETNEIALTDRSFDELKKLHETLTQHRNRCDEIVSERQCFINKSTKKAEVSITHRTAISYLYQDFEVDHPVLATIINLEMMCQSCQRSVRKQLVRST